MRLSAFVFSRSKISGAAFLEFLPTATRAWIVAAGLERDGRIDEIPFSVVLNKGRALVLGVLSRQVMPAGCKTDKRMLWLAADYLALLDVES